MVKGFCRDKRNYIVIITKGNSLVLLRTITQLARFTSMKHMCHFWSNMNPSCFMFHLHMQVSIGPMYFNSKLLFILSY